MVAHICNPRTWDVKAGRTEDKSQPQLHSKFEVSLGYQKCIERKSEERRNERQEKRKRRVEGAGTLYEKERGPRTNDTESRGGFKGMHRFNGRMRTVKKTKHRPTIQRLVQP